MSGYGDKTFQQQRSATFDAVIALVDEHVRAASPTTLLSRLNEISEDSLHQSAQRESWSLFLRGIQHLKNGAPDHQPGSMTEALSRTSLRSSAFAAALGVKPPQFEPMYFSVDYTTGDEAALFFCRRLIEAAEGDLSKSRQIIHHKMITERPAGVFDTHPGGADLLKRQMAISFNALADTYGLACHDFKIALSTLVPPVDSPSAGHSQRPPQP